MADCVVKVVNYAGGSRSFVLISEDLLTTLASSHAVLLLLSSLGSGELLLLLCSFDFVAHSIKLFLFIVVLVGEACARPLPLDPIVPLILLAGAHCRGWRNELTQKESFCHL